MKAKEWVKHISQFKPDTPEHDAAAEACGKECREIFQMRAKSIQTGSNHSFQRDRVSDRLVFAYKEAAVKWDSICHTLLLLKQEKEGPDAAPDWPFIKGMMLLTDIIDMLENEKIGDVQKAEMLSYFTALAERLGYKDEPAFKVSLNLGREKTQSAVMSEIIRLRGELLSMQLAFAMDPGSLSFDTVERAQKIRRRLALLTS